MRVENIKTYKVFQKPYNFADNKVKEQSLTNTSHAYNPIVPCDIFFGSNFNKTRDLFEDKELDSLKSDFEERIKNFPDYNSHIEQNKDDIVSNILNAVKESDENKISKEALRFVNDYFFEEKDKAKSLITCHDKTHFSHLLPCIVNHMRDNSGKIHPSNEKFVRSLIDSGRYFREPKGLSFIDTIKDENGVVKNHAAEFAIKTARNQKVKNPSDVIETYMSYPKEASDSTFKFCLSAFNDEADAICMFENLIYVFFDEETGEKNGHNLEMLAEIADIRPDWAYDFWQFWMLMDENKTLSPFVKEKALEFADDKKCSAENFVSAFSKCKNADGFNDDLFKKLKNINIDRDELLKFGYNPDSLILLLDKYSKYAKSSMFEQTLILEELKELKDVSGDKIQTKNLEIDIDKMIANVSSSINGETPLLEVKDSDKDAFISFFFGKKSTSVEKLFSQSIPRLKQLKNGLPLKYSRQAFLDDLSELYKNDSELPSKLGIEPIIEQNKIKGYDGIIKLNKLDKNSPEYALCRKFFYDNSVRTGDFRLDIFLNKLIKAMPEYLNIVGKPQHDVQKYTLDIHSVLVFANAVLDPEYKTLTGAEQAYLKLACLLHDISKKEGQKDALHPYTSAVLSNKIASRYSKGGNAPRSVIELIKSHEWLGEYQNSVDKLDCAKKIAFKFRNKDDFKMAKIMTRADMKSVNDEFYEKLKGALESDNLFLIEKCLKTFNSTGCALFSDYPLYSSVRQIQNHKGRNYKVINFRTIPENADMTEYGFDGGRKKENIFLLVHMLPDDDIQRSLKTADTMTKTTNLGVLSESLITPDNTNTFLDRKFGVLLVQNPSDIISINKFNQSSGTKKSLSDIIRLIDYSSRSEFRESFINELGIPDLLPSEYAEFYRSCVSNKSGSKTFIDSNMYMLGKYLVSGKQIKTALENCRKKLLNDENYSHNEIVACSPKIKGVVAKTENLSDIPDTILNYAYENKLPIIII